MIVFGVRPPQYPPLPLNENASLGAREDGPPWRVVQKGGRVSEGILFLVYQWRPSHCCPLREVRKFSSFFGWLRKGQSKGDEEVLCVRRCEERQRSLGTSVIRRLVCLLSWGELSDEFAEYNTEVAKNHLCREDVEALLWGSAKTEEDSRQLWEPRGIAASGHEGRLECPVKLLPHAIGLRVLGCSEVDCGAPRLFQGRP